MTRLVRGALAALLLVVLAGCDVASRIVVKPDGSGTYAVTLTVADGPGDPGDALFRAMKAASAKSPVPLPVERYSKGGESGAQIAYEFKSLQDLEAEAARLAKVGSGLGGVTVERGKDGWTFSAESAEGLVRPPGSTETGPPGGVIDATELTGLVNLAVVVQLPGRPGLNNATAVTRTATSSTFTWTLSAGRPATPLQAATTFVGKQGSVELATDLTPVSTSGSGGDSGLGTGAVLALSLGGLVLAAGVLVVAFRRTRSV